MPLVAATVILLLSLCLVSPIRCYASPVSKAPNFSLAGVDGKQHSLIEFAGKRSVLFFFCGCKWCYDAARNWSEARSQSSPLARVPTIIVYSGDADDARRFLKQTGLSAPSTTILLDQYVHVTLDLYQAEPCPRVFVLSKALTIVYTNNHKSDFPRTIDGSQLIQHVVTALKEPRSDGSTTSIRPVSTATPSSPEVFLTPVAGKGVTVSGSGSTAVVHYDFGTVSQNVTSTVDHIFPFRNNTSVPIVVDNLQPSCGCTTAAAEESSILPFIVQPGVTINIIVTIDLTQVIPSLVDKTVWINGMNPFAPLGVIEVSGVLAAAQ